MTALATIFVVATVIGVVIAAASLVLQANEVVIAYKQLWLTRLQFIYTVVKDLWAYFVSTMKQEIKRIYEWVYQILINLIPILNKMGLKFDDTKPKGETPLYKTIYNFLKKKIGLSVEEPGSPLSEAPGKPDDSIDADKKFDELLKKHRLLDPSKTGGDADFKPIYEFIANLTEEFIKRQEEKQALDDVCNSGETESITVTIPENESLVQLEESIARLNALITILEGDETSCAPGGDIGEIKATLSRIENNLDTSTLASSLDGFLVELKAVLSENGDASGESKPDLEIELLKEEIKETKKVFQDRNEKLIEYVQNNRRAMEGFQTYFKRLEDLIRKNSMNFDQIYYMFGKKLADDHKYKG